MGAAASDDTARWRDPGLSPGERADALIPLMTLEEKVAQLVGVWVGADASGGGVAPHQADMKEGAPWSEVIRHGLGQLTRPFGSAPIDPVLGARSLAASQEQIAAASRFRIPAQVHEECLTGFATWGATAYPAPLAWGAAFDPALVEEMSGRIGRSMRAVGVHQGLAPVLDVTRDYRWGRTEETIGEDPYLVGVVGAAYVRGLENAGIVATLKHFSGYSASRGGRNLAPVPMGQRELADVILPPFEAALRLGGARSVMNSYAEIDGVPVAADEDLLTRRLREDWEFCGTVVSDYFSVRFLQTLHGVAEDAAHAAGIALKAGIDVELPTVDTFGVPLIEAVRSGTIDESLIDRALRRVLAQKAEVGLLDADWQPLPAGLEDLSLDTEADQDVALRLARASIVVLRNTGGILPLGQPHTAGQRIALVGPVADDPMAMLGCYSFPAHVSAHSGHGLGLEIPTLRAALGELISDLDYAPGCSVNGADDSGIAEAVAAAARADVCVLAVGDRAGLFGRGTSGEGCDAADLKLPGAQEALLHALADTGKPVIGVFVTGRPYSIGSVAGRLAAAVQAFFPGEEGGHAIAGVLTGRVNPSGKLPVEIPGEHAPQPSSYLRSANASRHSGSSVDPTPLFAFGHGLSFTSFGFEDLVISATSVPTDGTVEVSCTVRNTGAVAGAEVVQLYLSDPVAQVVRPLRWLAGFARVPLAAGEARRVTFRLHADRTSFSGLSGSRIVEPGETGVALGGGSDRLPLTGSFTLTGPVRVLGADRVLDTPVSVHDLP
ncbi:MAG TPA: glycoside hydrolase family 3 N-terminal domain-containing protein [Actinocrinis sp.]